MAMVMGFPSVNLEEMMLVLEKSQGEIFLGEMMRSLEKHLGLLLLGVSGSQLSVGAHAATWVVAPARVVCGFWIWVSLP